MKVTTITVNGESLTITQKDNGYCYLGESGFPICEDPNSWPVEDLNEAVAIVRRAFA